MILYHGTDYRFDKFSKSMIGKNTKVVSDGFFLTDSISNAESYGSIILKCEVDLGAYIECDFNDSSAYYFGEEKWYTPSQLAKRISEINKDMENHKSLEIGDYGKYEIDDENSTDDELVFLYNNSDFTPEDYLDTLGDGGGFDHQDDHKIDSVICKDVKDYFSFGGKPCNVYIVFNPDNIKVLEVLSENFNSEIINNINECIRKAVK